MDRFSPYLIVVPEHNFLLNSRLRASWQAKISADKNREIVILFRDLTCVLIAILFSSTMTSLWLSKFRSLLWTEATLSLTNIYFQIECFSLQKLDAQATTSPQPQLRLHPQCQLIFLFWMKPKIIGMSDIQNNSPIFTCHCLFCFEACIAHFIRLPDKEKT